MNKLLIVSVTLGLLLSACRKQPATSAQDHSLKSDTSMDWKPLAFDYLVLKSKVGFRSKDNSNNVNANIRIRKDSVIWISVSPGMGIEVLRTLITPDSVKIINRIDNKYDEYSIAYIRETLGIALDFQNLQNLLVGDVLMPLAGEDQLAETDTSWQLTQLRGSIKAVTMISRIQKKVTRTEAGNDEGKYLWVNYKDFVWADSLMFHQEQQLLLKNGNDTTWIETSHQKIEFPQKNVAFPFNVPKRYEK